MKSKKWRVITIRNSQLQRVRRNMRLILKLAIDKKLDRLRKLTDLYKERRLRGGMVPSQRKREIFLIKSINKLIKATHDSIIKCSFGSVCVSPEAHVFSHDISSLEKDMAWNPISKQWICIDCYNEHFGTKEAREQFRIYMESEEKRMQKLITNLKEGKKKNI